VVIIFAFLDLVKTISFSDNLLAAVYSRRIDGMTLTLAPSGWTYENTFVLYDKESGTLWYPHEKGLKGIQGRFFGKTLPGIHSEDTRWGNRVAKYPHSEILR
jgi:hypothetical protein